MNRPPRFDELQRIERDTDSRRTGIIIAIICGIALFGNFGAALLMMVKP